MPTGDSSWCSAASLRTSPLRPGPGVSATAADAAFLAARGAAPAGGRRWRRRWWWRQCRAAGRIRHQRRRLQPAVGRDVGSRRQHLRRRRIRIEQPHREVQQGRQFPQDLGQHRRGPGPVQRCSRHRERCGRQHLRRRRRQQAHPGLRWRGHVQVADRQRRLAAGDLHLRRLDAVPLQLQLERPRKHGRRRDLQGAA